MRSYTNHPPAVGAEIEVRYQQAHPEHAVISGQRSHPWSPLEILLLTGFGLFGLVPVFPSKAARLALRLLARGAIARGQITRVSERPPGGDDGPRWNVVFELVTADRTTLRRELEVEGELPYKVGETCPVLYDPGWPDRATLFVHLDGEPRITAADRITYTRSTWKLVIASAVLGASAVLLVTGLALFVGAWF